MLCRLYARTHYWLDICYQHCLANVLMSLQYAPPSKFDDVPASEPLPVEPFLRDQPAGRRTTSRRS